MGCFRWLHFTSFWGCFSMEVGMLMHPAPLDQPPGWAGLERCFFLFSFVLFTPPPPALPFVGDPGQDAGCVCMSVLPAGSLALAGWGAPPSDHRPPEHSDPVHRGPRGAVEGNPGLGQGWLLAGMGGWASSCEPYWVFSFCLPDIKLLLFSHSEGCPAI